MGRIKAAACGTGMLFVGVVGTAALRTARLVPDQPEVDPSTLTVDTPAVAALVSAAVAMPTVSHPDHRDPAAFAALHAWLEAQFPAFHAAASRETVLRDSVLYTWPGTDPGLPPVVVMAHQDVVPVEAGTEGDWLHPPFSGAIAPCDGDATGDCVWGRGTLDMKATLVGLMVAAEGLAASGWQPERTLLFALGDDEEVSGTGAAATVSLLQERGVKPAWVLDEGMVIADGIVPGLSEPAALIGVAEKGFVSVSLTAPGAGGHSSMPPRSTAVGRLARAVVRLEQQPFDTRIDGPALQMFQELAPFMPLGNRLAFANLWLLGPVVEASLTEKNNTRALLHTTQAVTLIEGSPQDNILPQSARAVANFRIHPRDSVEAVLQHVRDAIDDPEVTVEPVTTSLFSEPSPVSSADSEGFVAIEEAAHAAAPGIVSAPALMIGGTDARHFAAICDQVFRFQPAWMRPGDTDRLHGTNERVPVSNLETFVRFHDAHLRRAGGS